MLKDYKDRKDSGNIEAVVVVAGELRVTRKQYDLDSGLEISPKKDIYFKEGLEARKLELENELQSVNDMLKEFSAKVADDIVI